MDKDKTIERHVIRALITPTQTEEFDFECVAIPVENGQLKRSWENDEYYMEVLKTEKDNIVTTRMDSGLPLFDNHPWDTAAMNTLGITVGYEFTEKGVVMRCKLGSRADEALRSDIKNGIIKTMSIEGDIYELTIERQTGMLPKYYATKWEPTSLSFAPVPQDIGSQIEVRRAIQKQIEKPETGKSFFKSLTNKF